jgi:hypothetical protein
LGGKILKGGKEKRKMWIRWEGKRRNRLYFKAKRVK